MDGMEWNDGARFGGRWSVMDTGLLGSYAVGGPRGINQLRARCDTRQGGQRSENLGEKKPPVLTVFGVLSCSGKMAKSL